MKVENLYRLPAKNPECLFRQLSVVLKWRFFYLLEYLL
jgi:hypothetical protein